MTNKKVTESTICICKCHDKERRAKFVSHCGFCLNGQWFRDSEEDPLTLH